MVVILDAENNVLQEIDSGGAGEPEQVTFNAPTDGYYSLRVSDFGQGAGPFELTVE
jgi:hypothetical protein